jgi:hypothetical protein
MDSEKPDDVEVKTVDRFSTPERKLARSGPPSVKEARMHLKQANAARVSVDEEVGQIVQVDEEVGQIVQVDEEVGQIVQVDEEVNDESASPSTPPPPSHRAPPVPPAIKAVRRDMQTNRVPAVPHCDEDLYPINSPVEFASTGSPKAGLP